MPEESSSASDTAELARKEKLYSTLVNSLDRIVWEGDGKTFQFQFVSLQAERILGYPPEEWICDPDFWRSHLHPGDRESCVNFRLKAAAEGRDHELEYRMIAADGRVVWVHDLVTVTREADESTCLRGIMVNTTEHKQMEAALRESEERFRSIFEQSAAGMVIVDDGARILHANGALCKFLGFSEDELQQLDAFQVVHPGDREGVAKAQVKRRPTDVIRRYLRKDGVTVWGHNSAVFLQPEGRPPYWFAVIQDITIYKHAEQQLLRLSDRLINAQEEERSRIARELHDDLSQQIAAVSIMLSNLKRQLPANDARLRDQTERAHRSLAQMAKSVRNLSHELHPAILEQGGLEAALEAYCKEFTALTGIKTSLEATGAFCHLSSAVALCLYRVAQEALQNVAKHAETNSAELSLLHDDALARMVIADKGKGFNVENLDAHFPSLGLISMRERVRLVSGTLELTSQPGAGTTITVCVPFSKHSEQAESLMA